MLSKEEVDLDKQREYTRLHDIIDLLLFGKNG